MNFLDYQYGTQKTALYPGAGNPHSTEGLAYVTLGLVGEAGEIANKVKKILRDDNGAISVGVRDTLVDEAGDVAWYLSQLCDQLGVSMEQVCRLNLQKLADRAKRNVIKGSGDNR